MGAAGQPWGCVQQITEGLTGPQLYKASRQEVRTTGRRLGAAGPAGLIPPPSLGLWEAKGRLGAGNRRRGFSKTGGREQSPPVPPQRGRETGFTEPTKAELGLELSFMALSPVLSLHGRGDRESEGFHLMSVL